VTLGGSLESSTTSSIAFNELNGQYAIPSRPFQGTRRSTTGL
jgi:hypothetical protein